MVHVVINMNERKLLNYTWKFLVNVLIINLMDGKISMEFDLSIEK